MIPKGYRTMALEILAQVPPGTTLGAMQSGALGYYAAPSIRVVNMDGVVNRAAADAISANRLGAYITTAHIGYFADWDYNLHFLKQRWGNAPGPFLREIGAAQAQGEAQVRLYRFEVPGTK